jgi:DnaJ-class molecular chaperone
MNPYKMPKKDVCPKCNGKGYIEEKWEMKLEKIKPTVHTCWDCLKNGRLNQ